MQGNNIGTTNISELPISNNVGIINPPMQQGMSQGMSQGMPPEMPRETPRETPRDMRSNVELYIEPKSSMRTENDSGKNSVVMDNSITQSSYNELVGQIQQADKLGVTQLPSRDIPNNTDAVVMDEQTQPNYIPEQEMMEDYIKNYQTPENVILEGERDDLSRDRLEMLYSNIQMPLLVSILYFLFNLPVIRKYMQKWIPNIFSSDGNPNFAGYLVNSILFGVLYYILNNSINSIVNA